MKHTLLLTLAVILLFAHSAAAATISTNTTGNWTLTFSTEQQLGQPFAGSVDNPQIAVIDCDGYATASDGSVLKTFNVHSIKFGQGTTRAEIGSRFIVDDVFQLTNSYNFTVVCSGSGERQSFSGTFLVGQIIPWWSNYGINWSLQALQNGPNATGTLIFIVFILMLFGVAAIVLGIEIER